LPAQFLPAPAPEGAAAVRFTLEDLKIEGVTAYAPGELRALYQSRLHTEISLADIYGLAADITRRYRTDGYFLSLAVVPNQSISGGVARIRVVEGYVSDVRYPRSGAVGVLARYSRALTAQKPVTARAVESFLLRIGDLPGARFRAVLSRADDAAEGAVALSLEPQKKTPHGSLAFDNYGSRYLGPHEVSASVTASLGSLNETTLSALTSVADPKLSYVALHESLAVWPDVVVGLDAALTRAFPGGRLKAEDINSRALTYGLHVTYLWLRQRDVRLALDVGLESRDVYSDIVGAPLTRDHVRALRVGLDYQGQTAIGAAALAVTVSRGLPRLGESPKGAEDLSRAAADPSFTKIQFEGSDLRVLGPDWSLLFAAAGQVSSAPLYASEAFGYGGPAFGRAFDASEIIGDDGASISAELRYDHDAHSSSTALQPFVFWDFGAVWNLRGDGLSRQTASSSGFGFRFSTPSGIGGVLSASWPVIHTESDPLYFTNRSAPRLSIQISDRF
jgi:hemolysin activation/secretion protein